MPLPGQEEYKEPEVMAKPDLLREQPLEFLMLTEDVPGMDGPSTSGIGGGTDKSSADGLLGMETVVTGSDGASLPKGVIEVRNAR